MEFFLYLLKVNIAIMLLYSVFRLFFQNDTFFHWKRIILLSLLLISIFYPLGEISMPLILAENSSSGNGLPVFYLDKIIVSNGNYSRSIAYPIMSAVFLFGSLIYFTGVVFFIFRMIIQLATIMADCRNTPVRNLYSNKVHVKEGLETPYSFFGWMVLDPDKYAEKELKEILCHEKTHIRQGHSFDRMLAEIISIFCWFNPFARLLKKEIQLNLEYLADRSVLASGYEAGHYQFHLLQLSYSKAIAKITNNFNVSLLKKRIFMMNKKQTSLASIWKYTLLLPVVAVLLFFSSCLNTKKENAPATGNETVSDAPAETPVVATEKTTPEGIDLETVFSHVEDPPQFPGGDQALFEWLGKNIEYPATAIEKGIDGRVVVRFIVSSTGKVLNPEIIRSLDKDCDKETLRVIKTMPDWTPGKQGGKAVDVFFSLPVLFKLTSSS
jgi:TonB family protein